LEQLMDGSHLEMMGLHDLALGGAAQVDRRKPDTADAPASDGMLEALAEVRHLREALARQKRTFDLAMTASNMGTWRYTLADNICIYDENAQGLYGLTEARFLHDEEGVKAKFHPEDLPLMWSRVAKALDPEGDGRYDVEYRVKQLDGSWRWLSAWGLVEFEGEGAEKRSVAIAGASRDLTERKRAEELRALLINELNHRVKNSLAAIQAITAQTLRTATDLPSARESLERRIHAMARAHDLLTQRSWAGASLAEVVSRATDAFASAQLRLGGPDFEISSKQALALSLALHELATNASKYGALSTAQGVVTIRWAIENGILRLEWTERGGPAVTPPQHSGFGSRLLRQMVIGDLAGEMTLDYDPAGVRCVITVELGAHAAAGTAVPVGSSRPLAEAT
jgi:two-component sensor histidine kinase/PAS domain-containing protein